MFASAPPITVNQLELWRYINSTYLLTYLLSTVIDPCLFMDMEMITRIGIGAQLWGEDILPENYV